MKLRILFLVAVCTAVLRAEPSLASEVDSGAVLLEWSGTTALRAGDYQTALKQILADTMFSDTGYRFLKLGLAHRGLENHSKALFFLRFAAQKCTLLAPIAYEMISRIEEEQGRAENALAALRSALEHDIPQRYEAELHKRISAIIREHEIDVSELSWVGPWFVREELEETDRQQEVLDSLVAGKHWAALDSFVGVYLDSFHNGELCDFMGKICGLSVPDSIFSTLRLYRIAKRAHACGDDNSASDWLHKALKQDDFQKEIPTRSYLYTRGMINYGLKNYNKTVRWLTKYKDKYGPTPRLVLTMARAYRRLGKSAQAAAWYDKHVKLYPSHGSSQAILWYRAWQHEEQGDYQGALSRYRRIYRGYRRGKRADDSYFRAGLIHYKLEQFDSAETTFKGFLRRYPSSSLAQAGRYWQGKARLAQLDFDEAKGLFSEIVSSDPLDYYAYRSRRMLALIGDTVPHPALDSVFDLDRARRWIDSISADRKVPLIPTDSTNYRAGVQLAMSGLTDHAVYYLEPLEIRYTTNLLLQFDLTALYRICGDPTLSFRVARRLAWRIPSEHRKAMPLAIHTLLYPSSFGNLIESEAERNGLDPSLISAVIRQESIFDPQIVSPVGAVGLMQIMPYTGEEIARQLNEEFVLDSLRSPRVNIRYGAFYIRQLLNQFDGNLVLALAGYNGGPHNVKKWYATNKGDVFDMFVEDIAFTETRRYVKKVLANFWTYVQLRRLIHGTAPEELPLIAPVVPAALQ